MHLANLQIKKNNTGLRKFRGLQEIFISNLNTDPAGEVLFHFSVLNF